MGNIYDLIVVGGGPAGSAAAITAARNGARVLLLEKKRFPRNKVCGEFVSAESLGLLSWLLEAPAQDLLQNAPRLPEVRFFSDGLLIRSTLDPPGASIARSELDAALWDTAKNSGVDARQPVTVQAIKTGTRFRVLAEADEFEGQAVINAAGRWSNLGARDLDRHERDKWLGVKAHFAEERTPQSVDLYFFPGGYCGVQSVSLRGNTEDNRINVCAKVRAGVASTLAGVFERHPSLYERSRNWRQLTETVFTSPLIFGQPNPVDGTVLLAGDAAGFVDPFVGDGISLALRSGALCSRSLRPFFAGKISLEEAVHSYRRAYAKDFASVFGVSSKIRQIFFLLPPVLRFLVLSAIKRSPALVHALVKRTR